MKFVSAAALALIARSSGSLSGSLPVGGEGSRSASGWSGWAALERGTSLAIPSYRNLSTVCALVH